MAKSGLMRLFSDLRTYGTPEHLLGWWRIWHAVPVIDWIAAAHEFKAANFRGAAERYARGIKRYPRHKARPCAELDFAYCQFQLGEIQGSRQTLEQLVNKGASLKDAFLLLAKLHIITGHPLTAMKILQKAQTDYPNDPQILLCLAHCVVSAGPSEILIEETANRLKAARKGIALTDPLLISFETALAYIDLRHGDPVEGERRLARVLATGVAPFEAILLRGELWVEQGRVNQGREQLQRALVAAPHDPRPLVILAESYLREGDFFEPEYALQLATLACSRSNWENAHCVRVLAEAYEANGDADTAEIIASRLKTLTSTNELNIESLASVEEQLQRLRTAKFSNA